MFYDVLELKDSHADQSVVPGKAVVLDTNVQLEALQLLLVTDDAATVQIRTSGDSDTK